ncbi:MAG: hypothetical protein Q8916_06495, partial [Bacteroidota bacterium]|nr:hypothetical protein [Bacteroidota bacterium]
MHFSSGDFAQDIILKPILTDTTMKTRRILLAAVLMLMSISIVHAETADEIINKHIEAIGGKKAWKNIHSIKLTGVVMAQGMEIGEVERHLLSLVMAVGRAALEEFVAVKGTGYAGN